ncbi:hypothetical protein [Hymenobacter terricola]|uniref:hypothetical protein n=1 Tax=Hymenobacter terricola TaxID=2819236 RepID=UPI001B304058|nr:hypothetical protein [Hymenobacter terricola]
MVSPHWVLGVVLLSAGLLFGPLVVWLRSHHAVAGAASAQAPFVNWSLLVLLALPYGFLGLAGALWYRFCRPLVPRSGVGLSSWQVRPDGQLAQGAE